MLNFRKIDGQTDLYALIGYPVSHSLSPLIHNYLFSRFELNSSYFVLNAKFTEDEFESFIKNLSRIENFKGLNITIPYKRWAWKISKNSFENLESINCIKFSKEGIFGTNTDILGFKEAMKNLGLSSFKNRSFLIIGAGATAESVIFSVLGEAKDIYIVNRTTENARKLKEKFKKIEIGMPKNLDDIDAVINTTPVGLHGEEHTFLDYKSFKKECVFFDVLYVDTPFVENAKAHGFKSSNGLTMLIYQAVKSFEFWTGLEVNDKLIKNLMGEINGKKRQDRQNPS